MGGNATKASQVAGLASVMLTLKALLSPLHQGRLQIGQGMHPIATVSPDAIAAPSLAGWLVTEGLPGVIESNEGKIMHFSLAVQVGAFSSFYSLRVNKARPGLAWVQERETVTFCRVCLALRSRWQPQL